MNNFFKSTLIISTFIGTILLGFYSCSPEKESTPPPPTADKKAQLPQISKLDTQIESAPQNPELYYKRAQIYFKNEGYQEAAADMEKAIALDSTQLDYYHFLTDIYLRYPQSYRAILTMKSILERFPDDIPSLQKMSHLYVIVEQYNDALQTIDKALQVDPQNAQSYFLRGIILQESGEEEEAIKAYRYATELDSDMIDAYIILGQLYHKREDPIALDFFNNAVRVDPNNVFALHTKANYLQQIGKTQEAIEVYKEITKVNMSYTDAYFNSGLAYLELDSLQKAYDNFNVAIQTDPVNSQAYYYRGLTGELLGKLQQARSDFEQTTRMDPNFLPAKQSLQRVRNAIENN